jgi:hypothetical protein
LWLSPTVFGLMPAYDGLNGWVERTGLAWLWLAGVGLLARGFWLMATRNAQTGIVWMTKIITDPYHDIKMYHAAPLALLRGEWIDPMDHVQGRHS